MDYTINLLVKGALPFPHPLKINEICVSPTQTHMLDFFSGGKGAGEGCQSLMNIYLPNKCGVSGLEGG